MIDFYNGQLTDIIPANMQNEQTRAISYSVQKALQKLLNCIETCAVHGALDKLPDQVLDLMAIEFRTQYYDLNAPRKVREQMVLKTMDWYMIGGTRAVLEEYLSTIYGGGEITEWYRYEGEPYHFKAIVSVGEDMLVTLEECSTVKERINTYKNVRSWLEILIFKMDWYIQWFIFYDVKTRMETEFYPRYNLQYHYWEGSHTLTGNKCLNGYDVDTLVDFYPVVQTISTDVYIGEKALPVLRGIADVNCSITMDAESTVIAEAMLDISLSHEIWIAGNVGVVPRESALVVMKQTVAAEIVNGGLTGVQVDVPGNVILEGHQYQLSVVDVHHEGATNMEFRVAIAKSGAIGVNCVYYRFEASVAPKVSGCGEVTWGYPVTINYQNELVVEKNLRYLEGTKTLAGTSFLNADIFNYTL